jgi:hypothetical protein
VIYDHFVPDVFLSKYQDRPLDLSSNDFYMHRQNAIEKRLAEILKWEDTEAQVFVQGMWEQHVGKLSVVSWRIFRDAQQAQASKNIIITVIGFLFCKITILTVDHKLIRVLFTEFHKHKILFIHTVICQR